MATRNGAVVMKGQTNSVRLVTWTGLLNGDDGSPFEFVDWADRAIQVSGTFGVGGTVLFEGSNDGTTWATLADLSGTAISLSAAGIKQVGDSPLFVRPRVSAGDGSTSLVVTLCARRIGGLL